MRDLLIRLRLGIRNILHIALSESKIIFRDGAIILFCLFLPYVYPLLYSWIYNNEVVREVPVAVVDHSHSGLSRQFIRMYDASPDVAVKYHCSSLDEVKELIGRQKIYGALFFPSDFEKKLYRMEQSTISVYCDMSFMLAYKAVYQTATAVQGEMNSQLQLKVAQNKTSREDEITVAPLQSEGVALFNPTSGYGTFIIPTVLMLIIQQTLLLGIGLLGGTMRDRQREGRSLFLEKNYGDVHSVIFGRSLAFFVSYIPVVAYLTMFVPWLFSFTSLLHWDSLLMFMVPYLLACIFFALTFSYLVPHREDVMLLVVFSTVPMLFLSGVSWPGTNIPWYLKILSYLLPSTFGSSGFVKLNTLGASLRDAGWECFILWVQAAVYFAIACRACYLHKIKELNLLSNNT